MDVLAAEQGGPRPAPRHAAAAPPVAPPVAAELTAPLGRVVERENVDPTAETTRMEPVTAPVAEDADDAGTVVEPIPLHGGERRSGRRARHSVGGRARRSAPAGLRGRVVLVGAAAAAALLAVASGGVVASGSALPGDALYPVKRVAESAGLAMTFDDASRARRQLEIAATRLSEVEQLASNTQAAPAPEVFTSAMNDFDTATDEGARLLLESAESDQASTATDDLRTWATEQSERLTELEPQLPADVDANTSRELLARLLGQTGGLEAGQACDEGECASRGSGDESEPDSDATKDATSTPGKGNSAGANEPDEPSRTPTETGDRENPGLLPDLLPDANREGQEAPTTPNEDGDSESTTEPESGDGGDVSVPLPLLPEVTLPPLLPGVPGITIG